MAGIGPIVISLIANWRYSFHFKKGDSYDLETPAGEEKLKVKSLSDVKRFRSTTIGQDNALFLDYQEQDLHSPEKAQVDPNIDTFEIKDPPRVDFQIAGAKDYDGDLHGKDFDEEREKSLEGEGYVNTFLTNVYNENNQGL